MKSVYIKNVILASEMELLLEGKFGKGRGEHQKYDSNAVVLTLDKDINCNY